VPFRIIGVVADLRQMPLGQPNEPVMYFAQRQFPFKSMYLTVRGSAGALDRVRHVVASADATVPIGRVLTLSDHLSRESASGSTYAAVNAAAPGVGTPPHDTAEIKFESSVTRGAGLSSQLAEIYATETETVGVTSGRL
jgi:hypothetical protein